MLFIRRVSSNSVKRKVKSLPNLVLNGLKDFMKQTKAHEMKLKQPQDGTRLSPKPTPRNKRNKTKKKPKGFTFAKIKQPS